MKRAATGFPPLPESMRPLTTRSERALGKNVEHAEDVPRRVDGILCCHGHRF